MSYPILLTQTLFFLGMRDIGIALIIGIVGATAWNQVSHANRREWEQANRVSSVFVICLIQ